ncbi:MAG: ATP-binding protein [Cytophagales bacterium]
MDRRRADIELLATKLGYSPAVAILGARQVGKTTLAKQAAEVLDKDYIYLDLESGQDLAKLNEDPETFLDYYKDKLVIIDEVQVMPLLFTRLRSIIDRHRVNGRFLLLGSASPHLVKGVSESLAGRVSYLDLNPFRLSELYPDFSMQKHWYRGGFPRAILANSDTEFQDWAAGFVRSYVERDLSHLFGYNLNPELNRKLWLMLAHVHSGIFNAEELARSLGVTAPVASRYTDFLAGAFLVYKIMPWYSNNGKRLVKAPKIYLKDSGLLHHLHRINTYEDLQHHPIVGASWEGYVIEQVMYHKPVDLDVYYYRTHSGTEVDLVLVRGNTPVSSIEIKYSNAPKVSKGFYVGIEDLGTHKNYVITPSSDTYPIKNALVCSLWDFVNRHLKQLAQTTEV